MIGPLVALGDVREERCVGRAWWATSVGDALVRRAADKTGSLVQVGSAVVGRCARGAYEFRLDCHAVNALRVHALPDSVGHLHVVVAWEDEDVDRCDRGRFGKLPNVQLVNGEDAIDALHRVTDLVQGDVVGYCLEENGRRRFDKRDRRGEDDDGDEERDARVKV